MEFGEFRQHVLALRCGREQRSPRHPARVRTITTIGDDLVFPLRAEYERIPRTLDGVKEKDIDPSGNRRQE